LVATGLTQQVKKIDGTCHCGNIRFFLRWPESEVDIPVRKCSCTFCRKHGGAWTSHRRSQLTVIIADHALVSKYRFGTKTADFYVCSICGVAPFVLSEINENLYAVVNINTFENAYSLSFSGSATNFDGEDEGSRLERRVRNWIPNVLFDTSAT